MKEWIRSLSGGILGGLLGSGLGLLVISLALRNYNVFGNVADWVSGIGTIAAVIISIQITKKQITAEKKKDREHFFLEQDYLVMDKIQEKLLANKIFIESSRYTLEATLFQNTDDEIKKFWIRFIESYRTRYRTLIDNNNYVRNKIDEYAEINPLIKGIQINELCNNNKIASCLSQHNIEGEC